MLALMLLYGCTKGEPETQAEVPVQQVPTTEGEVQTLGYTIDQGTTDFKLPGTDELLGVGYADFVGDAYVEDLILFRAVPSSHNATHAPYGDFVPIANTLTGPVFADHVQPPGLGQNRNSWWGSYPSSQQGTGWQLSIVTASTAAAIIESESEFEASFSGPPPSGTEYEMTKGGNTVGWVLLENYPANNPTRRTHMIVIAQDGLEDFELEKTGSADLKDFVEHAQDDALYTQSLVKVEHLASGVTLPGTPPTPPAKPDLSGIGGLEEAVLNDENKLVPADSVEPVVAGRDSYMTDRGTTDFKLLVQGNPGPVVGSGFADYVGDLYQERLILVENFQDGQDPGNEPDPGYGGMFPIGMGGGGVYLQFKGAPCSPGQCAAGVYQSHDHFEGNATPPANYNRVHYIAVTSKTYKVTNTAQFKPWRPDPDDGYQNQEGTLYHFGDAGTPDGWVFVTVAGESHQLMNKNVKPKDMNLQVLPPPRSGPWKMSHFIAKASTDSVYVFSVVDSATSLHTEDLPSHPGFPNLPSSGVKSPEGVTLCGGTTGVACYSGEE